MVTRADFEMEAGIKLLLDLFLGMLLSKQGQIQGHDGIHIWKRLWGLFNSYSGFYGCTNEGTWI